MRDFGADVRVLFSEIDTVHGVFCPEVGQDGMRLLAAKDGNLGLYIVRNGNLNLDTAASAINLDLSAKLKTITDSYIPVIIDSKKDVHFNLDNDVIGNLRSWKKMTIIPKDTM